MEISRTQGSINCTGTPGGNYPGRPGLPGEGTPGGQGLPEGNIPGGGCFPGGEELPEEQHIPGDLVPEQKLPEKVLTFEQFCKQQGINPGTIDHDLNGTRFKEAREKYDDYLEDNDVESTDSGSIFGTEESDSGPTGADQTSIFS